MSLHPKVLLSAFLQMPAVPIGILLGSCGGYMGIMEKNMETTIMGYIGAKGRLSSQMAASGFCFNVDH